MSLNFHISWNGMSDLPFAKCFTLQFTKETLTTLLFILIDPVFRLDCLKVLMVIRLLYQLTISDKTIFDRFSVLSDSAIKLGLDPVIPLEKGQIHILNLFVQLLIVIIAEKLDQLILLWVRQNISEVCHMEKFAFSSLAYAHPFISKRHPHPLLFMGQYR